jgi:hypothetical protein
MDDSLHKMATANGLPFIVLLLFLAFSSALPANAQTDDNTSYRLIGTTQSKSFNGAVLQDATGKQSFYQLLDKLPDGSQIIRLNDDSISLRGEDGALYEMYIAHDTKSTTPDSAYNASRSEPQHDQMPSLYQRKDSIVSRNKRMIDRARGKGRSAEE